MALLLVFIGWDGVRAMNGSTMKKLLRAIVVLSALFGSEGIAVAAEIHLDQDIAAIPPKITDIYNCGHWKAEKSEGFYRLIYVEFHYGNSLLYVQWMQDFTSGDPSRHVLHTLSIDELNANDHIELTFEKPKCMETKDGIRFNIEAESGHDGKRHRFALRVHNEFGKYSLKELADKGLITNP